MDEITNLVSFLALLTHASQGLQTVKYQFPFLPNSSYIKAHLTFFFNGTPDTFNEHKISPFCLVRLRWNVEIEKKVTAVCMFTLFTFQHNHTARNRDILFPLNVFVDTAWFGQNQSVIDARGFKLVFL